MEIKVAPHCTADVNAVTRVIQYFDDMDARQGANMPGINMRTWGTYLDWGFPESTSKVNTLLDAAGEDPCHTTGCLAGHIVLALHDRLYGNDDLIRDAAARLIGIHDTQTPMLFELQYWPVDLHHRYCVQAASARPKILADRLRYLLEHGW